MKGLNKVQFIGYLGKAPEVTNFENGGKKAEVIIATTDGYKDETGKWNDVTQWHNCYATGKLAEIIEKYFEKGMRVYIEGKLKHRSYTNKEGERRYVTEVMIVDFMFLTSKNTQEAEVEQPEPEENVSDDDLPF